MIGFLTRPWLLIWRYRLLLWNTTRADIRGKYAGTVLGMAWMALYPLLFLALYAVVYIMIFRVRFGEFRPMEYVMVIFAGLVPFLNFAEVLGVGVPSVTSNASLIKNTMFPIELIPVKSVLFCLPTLAVSLVLLETALVLAGHAGWLQLLCLVVVLLQTVYCIGLVWILSAMNVFMKDLAQIVPVVTLFLMLVSPIAYTTDMVPENLRTFMYFNPLYYMIDMYRMSMLGDLCPFSWTSFGAFTVLALVTFWIGFWLFSRLKQVFADEC